MYSMLALAVLVGMHHALEADHLAAVSSLAAGRARLSEIVARGLTWGAGHTITLFLFAGLALLLGMTIPEGLATKLEAAVGIMLVGLGSRLLWRMWKDRVHFHAHRHGDGQAHFHAHSHAFDSRPHAQSVHEHAHGFSWPALLVGMTHGMAGSAALLLITVTQSPTAWEGVAYIFLFGIGSMVGMGLVSFAIGLPLVLTAGFLTLANRILQVGVGCVTIVIGLSTIYSTVFAA